jgi:hypothetical protein
VFEGDSHVFTGFGDSAQGLIQWVSLKQGLFEVHFLFWQRVALSLPNFNSRF